MRSSATKLEYARHSVSRISVACGLLLFLGFIHVSGAHASFEQVKTFGEDNVQIRNATGTAINTTGAGGVPAGTVYIVAENAASVTRFTPQGEFRAAWGWAVAKKEEDEDEYQRCGPDGEVAHPTCAFIVSGFPPSGFGRAGEGLGQLWNPQGVAVDQSTGNVYVFNASRAKGTVQVFSADGSQRLGGFGELGKGPFPEPGESIEEGPEKFHSRTQLGSMLTVDESGTVYIPDLDFPTVVGEQQSRVMVFEPDTPGDYEHYVYAGRANDIQGLGAGPIASDYAGHIYLATDNSIYEYAPPSSTPVCKFDLVSGGILGMTADPATGEVYYFNYKNRNFHRLACNGEGKFIESEVFTSTPKAESFMALAFNPAASFDGNRPPGIFYAINPASSSIQSQGVGVGIAHVFAPGTVLKPIIKSQEVSEVGKNNANLRGVVNPNGAATTYVFQYISDLAYQENDPGERFAGAGELPSGGGKLLSGAADVPVAVALAGLQPDTQYHFRIVANNCTEGQEPSLCTTQGEEMTFRTFSVGAGGTPDHRAYELVSPAQKHGGQVYPPQTSFFTPSCLECKPGQTKARFPSLSSLDGERVVYQGDPFSFTEGAPNNDGYFSERTPSGWRTTTLSPLLGGSGSGQGLVGYDRDLSKGVLFQGKQSLTPAAPSGVPNLYMLPTAGPEDLSPLLLGAPPNRGDEVHLTYAGGSADLSHVFFAADDALTQETAVAPAAEFQFNMDNLYEYVEDEIRLVNVLPGNTETVPGSVFGSKATSGIDKDDLSHAISDDGSRVFWSDPSGQVYVREDGVGTRELSNHAGQFLTASADGSKVLLTDGKLIDLENEEAAVDLSQGQGGFLGIAGQSEDLSHVYFVDTAVLNEASNSEGASAVAGQNNLYSWDEGVTTYIATLNGTGAASESDNWKRAPAQRTAGASPNGEWLAFTSSASLTGSDNEGPCRFSNTQLGFDKVPCTQVFLYDASAGQLICTSCSPTEESPLGSSHIATLRIPPAALAAQRYLTDSGRLFFDSPNRLSPDDTNDGAEDVYEYQPAGVGTCDEAGGCVSLISAGDEFTDSNLLAIDPSGKNVFFTTRQKLSLRDRDELFDLYDARENGGIPAETETIRSECQGESCQAPVSVPNDPTPGSSTFQGAGNVVEKASKKGKKHKKHHKKHKKRTKKQKNNRNHNRGGAK